MLPSFAQWLHWVVVALLGLSLVAVTRGHLSVALLRLLTAVVSLAVELRLEAPRLQ